MSEVRFQLRSRYGNPMLIRFNTETCVLERRVYGDSFWFSLLGDSRSYMALRLTRVMELAERGAPPEDTWYQLLFNVLQASGKLEETLANLPRPQL